MTVTSTQTAATVMPTGWKNASAKGIIGLHAGMPEEIYRQAPGISQSILKEIRRSPKHFDFYRRCKPEPTPAMIFGTAFHAYLLEENLFKQTVAIWTGEDKRGNAWKDFKAANEGKFILSRDDLKAFEYMRQSIHENMKAVKLLQGQREVSFFWQDSDTAVLCKGRADILSTKGYIVDVKTTENASQVGRGNFEMKARALGYDIQAAMYTDGLRACGQETKGVVFIAVETKPPHCHAIYVLSPEDIEIGRRTYKELLATYRACEETGTWPGYATDVNVLSLPRFVQGGDDDGLE